MRKVLIVEDDVSVNDNLKSLVLKIRDTEVRQAYNRASAEDFLRSEEFALLIADVKLGEDPRERLSGLSLLRLLGERPTVAIIVSGMPEDMLPELAISLQAYDFISKPISGLDFINKVEHALAFQEDLQRSNGDSNVSTLPKGLEHDPKRKFGLKWRHKPVLLSLTELRLVHCLIERPNTVVDYETLAEQLKGPIENTRKTINSHMTGARRNFTNVDENFDAIDSEPGRGYIWRSPQE